MRHQSYPRWMAAALILGAFAGCGDDRPRVVAPGPTAPPSPTTSHPPSLVAVDINGPESIAPGQSAQFTATSRFSDGTSTPAANVQWVFSNSLVKVDSSGMATAGTEYGEGVIRARIDLPATFIAGAKTVLVLPERTYRVVGMVIEHATSVRLAGAQVEVTNDRRITAVTDSEGAYRLYGVPSDAEIRVVRDGYQPHVERLQIGEHATRNFQLSLAGARLDLAGSYTLTIEINCATSTPVRPPELRQRSYAAVLTQDGSVVEVMLTESSRFRINAVGRGNRFKGHADAAGATFVLQQFFTYFFPYDPHEYPDLLERIPDGTFLQIDGTAVTKNTPAGLSGNLNGFGAHYSSSFPTIAPGMQGGTLGSCYSPAHRFTLTRH